ncbi:MAG: AMIN domain-containing protein [Candidatus Desulfatibia sp.]|uniref:L,D-transpeptidase Cds6 family protein n=1 Tax=Candidatus Desulfatibia sp. TaxID=3101189 RepID=UPI002F346818
MRKRPLFTVLGFAVAILALTSCESDALFKPSDKPAAKEERPQSEPSQQSEEQLEEKKALIHLTRITYAPKKGGTVIKLYGDNAFRHTSYKLANPMRLAVELPDVMLDFEPKRIKVDDPYVTYISVVRFPKINSVRIEVELVMDLKYKVSQKPEYLEIALHGPAETPAEIMGQKAASDISDEIRSVRTKNTELEKENERLAQELFLDREAIKKLEEENTELNLYRQETEKTRDQTESLSKTLSARIEFMENKIAELQQKLEKNSPSRNLLSGPNLDESDGSNDQGLPPPSLSMPPSSNLMGMIEQETQVKQTVEAWLDVWNEKDYDKYTSYYSEDFTTEKTGYKGWMAYKKALFKKAAAIEVKAENMRISLNRNNAKVVFKQAYKSDLHRDFGIKTLVLTKEQNSWRIIYENWMPLKGS